MDEDPMPINGNNGHGSDILHLYLKEMGQHALITPKEEIALAKRIKQGDKKAREIMIKANLRLVVKIARGYEGMGVNLLDLISEGNIGLMKGVERFDPTKGAKFSTYGSWWIKQSIKRALSNQSKTVRMPVHATDLASKIHKFMVEFHGDFGRQPTDEEIAEGLDITLKKVRFMQTVGHQTQSLDAPIDDEGTATLAEVIADSMATDPSDETELKSESGRLRYFIEKLPPRERRILELRYGLNNGGEPVVLEEIGKMFGFTRERARQIEEIAKLRLKAMLMGVAYRPPQKKKKLNGV